MGIFQRPVIQEKEVFLKKIDKITFLFFCLIFILINKQVLSLEKSLIKPIVLDYLQDIKEFKSSFLQSQDGAIEEGMLYIKNNRVRIEYLTNSEIRIIISDNEGMYYNKELDELQYFNPKKNIAGSFFKFFYDKSFLIDAKYKHEENFITVEKLVTIGDEINKIKIYFESSPVLLKKIEIINNDRLMTLAIINPNFNPSIDNNFFSMADPRIIKSK